MQYPVKIRFNCRKCRAIVNRTIIVSSDKEAYAQAYRMQHIEVCSICNGEDTKAKIAARRLTVATANDQLRPINRKMKGIYTSDNNRKSYWEYESHSERALRETSASNPIQNSGRKLQGEAWTWNLLEQGRRGQDETIW